MAWLRSIFEYFAGLKRRWLGLVVGCAVWLCLELFGFWSTILLLVLSTVGFVVGRILEENESWREIVDKLLSERFLD